VGPIQPNSEERYSCPVMTDATNYRYTNFSHVTEAKLMVAIQTQRKRLHVITPACFSKQLTTVLTNLQTTQLIHIHSAATDSVQNRVQTGIAAFGIQHQARLNRTDFSFVNLRRLHRMVPKAELSSTGADKERVLTYAAFYRLRTRSWNFNLEQGKIDVPCSDVYCQSGH